MSDIIIRPATADDIPTIQSIYAYYVRETVITFEENVPDIREMTKRYETILGYGMPYLVAETNGQVIGYAYASLFRGRPAYRYTTEHSIYLDPDKRGMGVGTKMLDALMKACEPTGVRQIIAVISDAIDGASVALHKKAGFELIGTMPATGYKFDKWVNTTIMQRPICTGSSDKPDGIGLKLT